MKDWAEDVNTVEEFLDRYCKADRFRERGEGYAAMHILTYTKDEKEKGYCYITQHDSRTGREIYFKSNKLLILCDGCDLPILDDDYDDRCTPHEENCPNFNFDDDNGVWTDCDCDLNYHPKCCPECNHA